MEEEKILVIGLDLSFNSTGICAMQVVSGKPKNMRFYRVVFDNESNKTGKIYKPNEIRNIIQETYRMPTNINAKDLLVKSASKNDIQQIESTIRAMICSKRICNILSKELQQENYGKIVVTIENYIMPSFGGQAKLKDVSGLIMLQGFVREFLIRLKVNSSSEIKLFTPSPTTNKKEFVGVGKADKFDMLEVFLKYYDGQKLLPDISHGKLDDIIDAFSLMIYGYKHYMNIG